MSMSIFPEGYDPRKILSRNTERSKWSLPDNKVMGFYRIVTTRCFSILSTNADCNGDEKLSRYIEDNFDELIDEWTPVVRNLMDTYFAAPMQGEPVEWVDPWDFIYDMLPWSEIER